MAGGGSTRSGRTISIIRCGAAWPGTTKVTSATSPARRPTWPRRCAADGSIAGSTPTAPMLRAAPIRRRCRPGASSSACRTTTRSATAPSATGCISRSTSPPTARRPCCCCARRRRRCCSWARSGRRAPRSSISPITTAELGRLVTKGRRREFARFLGLRRSRRARARIPDPQAVETFERSRLRWEETVLPPHDGVLCLYRDLLRLRAAEPALQPDGRNAFEAAALGEDQLLLLRRGRRGIDPGDRPAARRGCRRRVLRSSRDLREALAARARYRGPALLLRPAPAPHRARRRRARHPFRPSRRGPAEVALVSAGAASPGLFEIAFAASDGGGVHRKTYSPHDYTTGLIRRSSTTRCARNTIEHEEPFRWSRPEQRRNLAAKVTPTLRGSEIVGASARKTPHPSTRPGRPNRGQSIPVRAGGTINLKRSLEKAGRRLVVDNAALRGK